MFVVFVFPVLFLEVNQTEGNVAKGQDNVKVQKITDVYISN